MCESRLIELSLTSHHIYTKVNTLRLQEVCRQQSVFVPLTRSVPLDTEGPVQHTESSGVAASAPSGSLTFMLPTASLSVVVADPNL